MKIKVLAIALAILAFFLFVGSPFQQAAKAVVLVDDAVVMIIIAALAAFGITFSMTGGIQTLKSWLQNEILESGVDFSGVKYGANSLGNLLLNNRFVRAITALANYLIAKYNLANGGEITLVEQSISLGQITVYPGSLWQLPYKSDVSKGIGWRSSKTVYTVFLTSGKFVYPMLYDDSRFTCSWHGFTDLANPQWGETYESVEYSQTDFYYVVGMNFAPSGYVGMDNVVVYNYSVAEMIELLSGQVQSQREELIANVDVLDVPTDQEIGDNGGILVLPIPWGQTLPQTISEIPGLVLDDGLAGETELELEDAEVVEDQVSDTATNQQEVSQDAADYQVTGLASVFPFCIPFDIYSFFECLAAAPVAPSFEWRFYVPGICDETIELDLSQFDTVAQIVRTMELLAFIVGLAFVTRDKMIKG